jgi:hypothetical protein
MRGEPKGVHEDCFNMMCGELVGSGSRRKVFDFNFMSNHVVKVEQDPHSFQNIHEWEVWRSVSETDYAKWFAPCKYISPNGQILIMERTLPLDNQKYPKLIPAFFTDTKYGNFGLLKGKFVCHDYGIHLFHEQGMSKRMRKAYWWD